MKVTLEKHKDEVSECFLSADDICGKVDLISIVEKCPSCGAVRIRFKRTKDITKVAHVFRVKEFPHW